MPTTCAAFGCSNNSKRDSHVTFHRLPSHPERRRQWLDLLNRENFIPSLHTFLCSEHFEEPCFDRTGQTVRLRANAVPTIFIYPDHMLDKIALAKKTTIIRLCEKPPPQGSTLTSKQPASLLDHAYCLPSPAELKRKIWELERKLELAHKKIKIYQQRERRIKQKYLTQNINLKLHERTEDASHQEITQQQNKDAGPNLRMDNLAACVL
ncbi:THAP domain-containing protein 2-like [Hyperolius riggenbachi]|uniref:THAP domain-containing protein 2-like n=1 Tax=Hyperolius riggenbachi TaxID=752182 RepID=UPI0035A31D34